MKKYMQSAYKPKQNIMLILYAFIAANISLIFISSAQAQNTSASDVYRNTEEMRMEVAAFHEADFTTIPETGASETPIVLYRHVLQKARLVFQRVQWLRYINGLPVKDIPAFPVRNITPTDVKHLLDDILSELQELRSNYGIEAVFPVSRPASASPSEIYLSLNSVEVALNSLGIPELSMNELYQLSNTITSDLEKIRTTEGIVTPVKNAKNATNKSLTDAYDEAFNLLTKLKMLTQTPGYDIPGGVLLPVKLSSGSVSSADLATALNHIIAELGAIKQTVDAKSPTEFSPLESGKTPTDVYNSLVEAQSIVNTLL
ncbi:MAG: hypothetical protein H6908_04865 [Hyphomicrobiales bacterium]|nr:hypothetical protein [Hyphomicrobiales bacterium]